MSDDYSYITDWRRLLTSSERRTMLEDIARVSLAAGATLFPEQPWTDFPSRTGLGAALNCPVEQLGFIEARLSIVVQAVRQILCSPLTNAATYTHAVLPQKARRVPASAWMEHARHVPSRRTVAETVSVLSTDTPENRAVKSFIQLLERDSKAIARIAQAEEEPRTAERAECCARSLHRMITETGWEEVHSARGDWTRLPTQRETLRPDYAQLARERSRYRKRFQFDWDCPLLTLPQRETWRLYEVWCLMTVLAALRKLGWEPAHNQEVFAVREGRLTWTLATGELSRVSLKSVSGHRLSLTYNQTFAEGQESLSHTMVPDITLSNGDRIWILDAKFKPYAQPGEEGGDINQMHAYRDAIVGAGGIRNVASAWCLYAGLADTANRPQITYGRSSEAPVGALCLRPGSSEAFSNLQRLLEQWLASSLTRQEPRPFP